MSMFEKIGSSAMVHTGFVGAAALALMGTAALAQSSQNAHDLASARQVDLQTATCWDVVTLAEDDRASTMTLLYGYVMGVNGQSTISPRDIQIAIVNTMMKCVDVPDTNVLTVLREQMLPSPTEE